MQTDPVCNMLVDEDQAEATSTHMGETFYFCSEECKQAFDQDPERYARAA